MSKTGSRRAARVGSRRGFDCTPADELFSLGKQPAHSGSRSPTPTTLQKTFYYSEYGPMIAANLVNGALPAWGDSLGEKPVAFTYRDANADTASQTADQWLAMGKTHNLAEFKKPFQACGSMLWVNTMYADTSSRALHIDGTSAPSPSSSALAAYAERVANDTMLPAPAPGARQA